MNLAFYIYLCDIVANLGFMSIFGMVVSAIVTIFTSIVFLSTTNPRDKEDHDLAKKIFKFSFPVLILMCFIRTTIPTTRTMYAMAAAYYGEQAVKSEAFQKLNSKAMQLLEVKIDEILGDKKEEGK
jgi:hypothetical protein